jgi:phosphate transport system permease protein
MTDQITRAKHNRIILDTRARRLFLASSSVPLALVLVVLATLVVKSWPILTSKPLLELLTGVTWRPLQGEFGFSPFITGTVWVTVTALLISVPPCILTALYLSEYAGQAINNITKPLLDVLAAIPSVVYGVWGLVAIVPWVQNQIAPGLSRILGFIPIFENNNPTGFSILSGALVLAVMIAPFIIAVTYEVLRSVPDGYRQASLALGATRWQTIRVAIIPQVLPGLFAAVVLGASRAFGETIAVLMVVGNVVQVPGSIFDAGYPLPALIANNYGEMLSIPMYDSALMTAALILLVMVMVFNIGSQMILRRFMRDRK